MNDVTVIVPTRNRPELLRQTLAAIASQDHDGVVGRARKLGARTTGGHGPAGRSPHWLRSRD